MPKIPTFTSAAEPTTQVGSVASNLKLSPTKTMASTLLPTAENLNSFYIKQRDNNEKLKAKQKFYEMKIESDRIQKTQENNPDELSAVFIYNKQFGEYRKQQLSKIENKRVKRKLELLLDSDQAESVYKVKSNSFKAFEDQNLSMYNTEQNTLASEYSLADNQETKNIKKQSRIDSATEFANMHEMGNAWLDKEIQTINTDSAIFDADVAIANGDYNKAKEILLTAKNVDAEEMQKRIITIEKQKIEYDATGLGVQQILEGKNPLIGQTIKGTTDQKVLNATDNYLFGVAEKNNLNEEQTFAVVDDAFAKVGLVSPRYQETIEAGFTAGSATTFDSPADIPEVLIQAVKAAETADQLGRLNLYTTDEQEIFFQNIIVSKQILGLNDFDAIKNAKNIQMNYDKAVFTGASKTRNRTLTLVETDFKDTKATNIGEVKGYANKLFDMYVASNIDPKIAQKRVISDLDKNLQIIDGYAYMKRNIDSFKSIGGLDQVKPMKEYIIKNKMTDEDPDDFYLRYNDGGIFEIRSRLDESTVYDKDNNPMIYYAKDLFALYEEKESKGRGIIKKRTQELQTEKTENKEKNADNLGLLDVEGS
jgi:hypothetical protein